MLSHEFDVLRQQASLAEELKTTSHLLSPIISDDDVWHVKPNFSLPPDIKIGRYNVSDQLSLLAAATTDLHVVKAYIPGVYEPDQNYPAFYEWDFRPPREADENCTSIGASGLGMSLSIPNFNYPISLKDFEGAIHQGFFDVEKLTWRRKGEEQMYDWKKDESIFTERLGQDQVAKFEVANWVLKAVLNSSEVHNERNF